MHFVVILSLLTHYAASTHYRAGPEWKYSTGYINEDMLREHLLPPGPDTIAAMCGPPPMVKFACIPNLEKLGYTEDMMITF